jgi:membrane-associated phospholipid phosphatase
VRLLSVRHLPRTLRALDRADRAGLLALRGVAGRSPRVGVALSRFSKLGEHGVVWLAIGGGGAMLDRSRRAAWLRATRTVLWAYALNTLCKLAVRRRRPTGVTPLTATPTQLSFPSAHAVTAFAGARVYARLGLPRGPLHALAGALALSRVALGVHYPSDVLAGAALGRLVAGARR